MRRILFTVLATAVMLSANAANPAEGVLKVKGMLKNFGDSLLVYVAEPGQRPNVQNTIVLKNGAFDFEIKLPKVAEVTLATPEAARGKSQQYVAFVGVPGETIELNAETDNKYTYGGTKFYKEFAEMKNALENSQAELQAYIKSLNERMEKGEKQEDLMKEYQEKAPALQAKASVAYKDFIKAHPDYEANAIIVTSLETLEEMEEAANMMSPAVREGRMKDFYMASINQQKAEKEIREKAAKMQAAGVVAPDFTLNNINGKPFKMSSLKGKYVVLDFWGSWCGWCIKGFPKMKEYYQKYKGKFEILGVDCNDTPEKWKAAVKKHELPWLNVYNPRESKVLSDYAIQGFPTKIIVGPDGKIIKTIVGEDPAFYTLLDELFGKGK
ncbi:redoxin domain-containing protein [Hoylesella loescheii]|uniref:Antioxidant, AhpC/TSA family n=1 Tax=Hoylesella loescheii DSM 19665 = JCM 12249 = ATCC 15930 TaxID=1122985 RepID=A0A069QHU2_HOYLO|nr:redoxin domain-containing protein [Hoylesella loescheii]KDR51589.1 antioxidant, AhpC/TSA family [Hoylesella loescheii DSM 19665 = JCM 12249 = ATCC 15930]